MNKQDAKIIAKGFAVPIAAIAIVMLAVGCGGPSAAEKAASVQADKLRLDNEIKMCTDRGMQPILHNGGFIVYVSDCIPANSTVIIKN